MQPGSLESEAGINCMSFDVSGSRLITGEVDKTIKREAHEPAEFLAIQKMLFSLMSCSLPKQDV